MSKKEYLSPCIWEELQCEDSDPLCTSIPSQGTEDISTGGGEYDDDDFNNY